MLADEGLAAPTILAHANELEKSSQKQKRSQARGAASSGRAEAQLVTQRETLAMLLQLQLAPVSTSVTAGELQSDNAPGVEPPNPEASLADGLQHLAATSALAAAIRQVVLESEGKEKAMTEEDGEEDGEEIDAVGNRGMEEEQGVDEESAASGGSSASEGESGDEAEESSEEVGEAGGAEGLVLIMRGLPGSGKSHVGATIRDCCSDPRVGCDVAVCSADAFFEQGGTLSRKQLREATEADDGPLSTYRAAFDLALLQRAHDSCRADFVAALDAKVRCIIVDNTNARREQYAYYVRQAYRRGYAVGVVEIHCPNADALAAFHRRCTHGVPLDALRKMRGKWEVDPAAILLVPSGPGLLATPENDGPRVAAERGAPLLPALPSLQHWLTAHQCFHHSHSRPRTHLQMAVSGESAKMVCIPPAARDEFHSIFAQDSSHKFLCELHSGVFRFFADVDLCVAGDSSAGTEGEAGVGCGWLLRLCSCLQTALRQSGYGECRVIASATAPEQRGETTKYGVHLHAGAVEVTTQAALDLRAALVAELHLAFSSDPEWCKLRWGDAVDEEVYRTGCGLRMLGSLKVKKGNVLGRVYRVAAVVEANGQPLSAADLEAYAANQHRVLTDISIHPAIRS